MTSVNYGHDQTGEPQLSIELGHWSYFEDAQAEATKKARAIVSMVIARELMLRWAPVTTFVKNARGNAEMQVVFLSKIDPVSVGFFMVALQAAWFVFLTDEKRDGNFARWDPNGTPAPKDGPTNPHDGGVDFAELRRQRREERRIR